MELIREFSKLSKHDAAIAGGKGASLGEMTQAGIPVPPGFVVLTSAFDRFLEETDLNVEIDSILDQVNHKEIHTVEHASQKIQALIIGAAMPKDIKTIILSSFKNLGAEYVAVRSSASAEDSASAAWAGQLDSFLNTTESNLLEKVQKCWASLFTPRAIFYRFEKGMHGEHISVAVVVQKMVNSERSGIAFSVHPVTEDYNQLIIEAGFGLGEAIVSGSVTPDSYVVEKEPRRIIDVNVNFQNRALYRKAGGGNTWIDLPEAEGSKQILTEKEINELSGIIVGIENHYKFPCDIEWAFESGKFYIVQSRPITTLQPKVEKKEGKEEKQPEISIGDWKLIITRNMSFWHQYLSSVGHSLNTKDFGVKAKNIQLSITVNGTETHLFAKPENMKEYSAAILEAVSSEVKIKTLKNKYKKFAKELLDSLKKCDKNLNVKTWNDFVKNYTRFCAGLFLTSVIGRAGLEKLMQKLKEKGYKDEEIPEVVSIITYPSLHTPLFDSQLGLLEIGALVQKKKINQKTIKKHLEKWLENFGFIPVNFCEEPWSLKDAQKQLSDFLKKDCAKELTYSKKSHKDRVSNAKKIFKEIKDEEISILAKALAEGTYLNEFRKNVFSRVSLGYRKIFSKIAKKGGSSNWRDCFFLTATEMTEVLAGQKTKIKDLMDKRQSVGIVVNDEDKIEFLKDEEEKSFKEYLDLLHGKKSEISKETKIVKGFTANKGKITGIARIILNSADFHKIAQGEILVTTMTSVDFVPIMDKAGAFVTNEGGITSHAAIVSREMNKPCIIGTQNATQVIKDGDMVEVDAERGIVKILERSPEYSRGADNGVVRILEKK
ncbi:hypothetical protein A3A09_02170 [Candidatus Nomurabacteria bacterium RIFCSPLOWO2_01_FULL_42_20]|nr:MAG: hypothetical protein A3A09_02170 [Candidatus Nomurabacteria bacterium RIFCSPLOWO2_01_FULL_42_20]